MRLLRQLLMRKRRDVQKVARWCWSNDGVSWSPVCDDVARCHILREIGGRLMRIPPTVASVPHYVPSLNSPGAWSAYLNLSARCVSASPIQNTPMSHAPIPNATETDSWRASSLGLSVASPVISGKQGSNLPSARLNCCTCIRRVGTSVNTTMSYGSDSEKACKHNHPRRFANRFFDVVPKRNASNAAVCSCGYHTTLRG
jgi:hypothetical protein